MAFRDENDSHAPVSPDDATETGVVAVRAALADTMFGRIDWVRETGSTNADLLHAAAAGAPHGAVLVTDHQTAGRGRRGRQWTTAPGDALLVSILLRPDAGIAPLGTFTAAVAVAASSACDRSGHAGVKIKWPNDLVVGGAGERRKLAGVLAQSTTAGTATAVVVGMGLNVRSGVLQELAPDAVALDQIGPGADRAHLLIALLRELAPVLTKLEGGNTAELWDRYRSHSATLGTRVRATFDGDQVLEGEATAITEIGALVIRDDNGVSSEIVAADVTSLR
jgi:BirA family biotin operon repressor/biotin-[acetyl-CoA-carboxylase] ligase